jgi:hypothetical protein
MSVLAGVVGCRLPAILGAQILASELKESII